MFREKLKELTERVPGANAALIMGLDGISVDKYAGEGAINLEALSAEYLSMIKNSGETVTDLGAGDVKEFNLVTDELIAIIMSVTPEYFVVLALLPSGSFGRARYELKKASFQLASELS